MTRREMKKNFAKFLKDEGVFLQFKRNCDPGAFLVLFEADKYSRWVARAFTWESSPEKHDFWSAINEKWKAIAYK